MPNVDDGLRQFATNRQWECYVAHCEHGSNRAAAAALGIGPSAVQARIAELKAKAARAGYSPEHGLTVPYPDGFKAAKVTIQRNAAGQIERTWERMCADNETLQTLLDAAREEFARDLPQVKPSPAPPTNENLLTCYPVGDHHFGMYAWHGDAGSDHDLEKGADLLRGAFDYLVNAAPPSKSAAVILLGDNLHYDSMEAVTPASKHLLDADGRYGKVADVTVATIRYAVERALQKHETVRLVISAGNHDPSSSVMLRVLFAHFFETEPRVTVDTGASVFHYIEHGKCLVGVHHGDKTKMQNLPGVMAADRAEAWGRTKYRYWYTGHVHHDSVKDYPGVRCESFRILAPTDAYTHSHGYRAGRDMKAITLHREHGELGRITFTPEMLDAA